MKNPRRLLGLALIVASALTFHTDSASAQEKTFKEQLTGAWTLVSNDNVLPDGTKRQNFGPDPKGTLILDGSGRFAFAIRSPDRPKFKGNNRLEGTAEENQGVVRGSNFTFGAWSVDEAKKILSLRIEGSMLPNQEGAASNRPFTLVGDELKITTPNPSAGGSSDNVFKRAR
jgi:hypothetical protein